jgi:large subunit ribosomal protein L6
MSELAKPIPVPDKVKVDIKSDSVVVTGPRGTVTNPIPPGIKFEQKDKQVVAIRKDDSGPQRAFHGLARALVANAVKGVTEGFTRELEIVGVGYRAESRKSSVVFTLGSFASNRVSDSTGISITVDKQTKLVVSGVDRHRWARLQPIFDR